MSVGWVITKDHFYDADPEFQRRAGLSNRTGIGQTDEDVVFEDGAKIWGRTVTVETGIDPADIEDPVKFRTCSDDGPEEGLSYSGLISQSWIDGTDELAFAPLRFAEADVGDTIMEYRKDGKWEML